MKILLFGNTDWYLYNFRRTLALSLRDAGYEVILTSPKGAYGTRFAELGLKWIAAPMDRRSLNPWAELQLLAWLRELIRKEEIALIHAFTIKCAVYGSLVSRITRDCPRVSAIAGLGYIFSSEDVKARLLRPFVRMLLRVALGGDKSRVILQNPDDVDLFATERLAKRERIRLIRSSGVDISRFVSGGVRRPGEPLTVLLAARLLWAKGLAEYVEASRQLRAQGRMVRFLLAGSPDDGNPTAVSRLVVDGWVKNGLVEWLSHVEDMPALLAHVHVMVLPTKYGEGVPRSLIEAAACGLPIITTDAPGCREVVTHEVEGLLVPPGDAAALALAIGRLDSDPALARRLGEAARRKAHAEFDERIVIRRTLEVYRELLTVAA